MAQINPQTLADAQKLGVNPYELILTNWGNLGAAADPNSGSVQYPPTKSPITRVKYPIDLSAIVGNTQPIPSIIGLAIAPRSTVDRCLIEFSQPQAADPVDAAGGDQFGNPFAPKSAMEQLLSTRSPLIGRFNGPMVIYADSSTLFNDTYQEAGNGFVESPFGTALNTNPGIGIFQVPELRVFLYLDSKAVLPPSVRAPFHDQYKFSTVAAADDVLTRVVPINGRKNIRVSVFTYTIAAPLPTSCVISVSGTFHTTRPNANIPVPTVHDNKEVPLVESDPLNPQNNDAVNLVVPTDPGLAFLLVKIKSTDGVTGIQVSIDAFD